LSEIERTQDTRPMRAGRDGSIECSRSRCRRRKTQALHALRIDPLPSRRNSMIKRLTRLAPFLIAAGCTQNGVVTADPSVATVTDNLTGGNGNSLGFHPVAAANPKVTGASEPNILPPELIETPVAQGSFRLENPATIALPGGGTLGISR